MPTINRTPEPYSSTTIHLSGDEFRATGPARVLSVLCFPATVSGQEITPAGFQMQHPGGKLSEIFPFGETDVLPPSLQSLVTQVLSEYIRQGPVPAVPPLSAQAERVRAQRGPSFLGRRAGKGRWV